MSIRQGLFAVRGDSSNLVKSRAKTSKIANLSMKICKEIPTLESESEVVGKTVVSSHTTGLQL